MADPKDVEPARFVKWLDPDDGERINDLKAYTWATGREHAIVEFHGVYGGRPALVCGGKYGMTLELRPGAMVDPLGRPLQLPCVDVDGQPLRVQKLVAHTHPEPTGPSDADFKLLELLGQDESVLYEINGPIEGTVFRTKRRAQGDKR
jgi:hypothetical protein